MRHKTNRHGLTLLELMIVLVILVGLIAMVGPRLLNSQAKADIKTTKTQIANLEAALKMYKVDMRSFPSTEDGLAALITLLVLPSCGSGSRMYCFWHPGNRFLVFSSRA